MTDEGTLDPWVADWLAANPVSFRMRDVLEPARSLESPFPVTREVARVSDELVDGVLVRLYVPATSPTGLIVYLHGGAMCIGSVGIMDNVARELAHATGAVIASVNYRLAPEHPFPAGLDDCETVARWALTHTERFGLPASAVMVAGESAGGTMTAGVTLRLQAADDVGLAGQVLIYPALDGGSSPMPSRLEFATLTMYEDELEWVWDAYTGGRDLDDDPFAAPLHAGSLAGLPPALVILGGCDFLRDEGRLYASRLREAGVETEEVCYPGQIHGFMNHMFPAAADAYEVVGRWVRARFETVVPVGG
jgi:acetyl esterase